MGNKLGWIIAGALLAVFLIVVVVFVIFPSQSTTPPTDATTRPGRLEKKTIDTPVEEIVGYTPSGSGNAGDDYAEAADLYEQREDDLLESFREIDGDIANLTPTGVGILESIHDLVARGAKKKDMRFTTVHDDKHFLMTHEMRGAKRLQRVGTALKKLGQYYLAVGKTDKARDAYRHEYVLGWHMINERSRYHMVRSGIGNQRDAVQGLAAVARRNDNDSLLASLEKVLEEMNRLSRFYHMKLGFIWKAKPRDYAGDVFNIAENDEDRAWRAEAVLFLGVLKFTQGHEPDLEHIKELLKKYLASDDPYIRTAAEAADEFTLSEFNRLDTIEVD